MVDTINKIAPSIGGIGSVGGLDKGQSTANTFTDVLKNAGQNVVNAQEQAQQMSLAVANGENIPMQDVVAAVTHAELSLQTMMSVRDKAVNAYQQVMQMPI